MSGQKQLAWYANLIMNVTSLCKERKWLLNENHLAELIKYAQTYSEQTIHDYRFLKVILSFHVIYDPYWTVDFSTIHKFAIQAESDYFS